MWLMWIILLFLRVHAALSVDIPDHFESIAPNTAISGRPSFGKTVLDPFLENARVLASREIDRRRALKASLSGRDVTCDPFLLSPTKFDAIEANQAELALEITRQLARLRDNSSITLDQFARSIQSVNVSKVFPQCAKNTQVKSCLPLSFPLSNGECNNVENPIWGSTDQPLFRLLDPAYDNDNLADIRSNGLPTAADVSRVMHSISNPSNRQPTADITLLIPAWMHFIQQDILQLATSRNIDGSCPLQLKQHDCCPLKDANCFNMANGGNLELCANRYIRLAPALMPDCALGSRIPTNLATAFIDGSHFYGTDQKSRVRQFKDGLLKVTPDSLAPSSDDPGQLCLGKEPCFEFGSFQSNFHPITQSLHTLFVLHHNRMATKLKSLNPHWTDDRLFQESRRIVMAKLQVITYREFLPLLIGRDMMHRFGISLDDSMENDNALVGYRRKVITQISDGFSAAVANIHYIMWPDSMGNRKLGDLLFNTDSLRQDNVKSVMSKAISTKSMHPWRLISSDLTNLTISAGRKIDLAATIVQMGRDMGAKPYIQWRKLCKLPADTFDHLNMDADTIKSLRSIYRSIHDIDLFTGAISERPIQGGLVGPTLACLIADQFQRLRFGDRFWFQNRLDFLSGFSQDQLTEISGITMARLLCDEADIGKVQPSPFVAPDIFENQPLECSNPAIPTFDISKWAEAESKSTMPVNPTMLKKALELGRRLAEEKRKAGHAAATSNARSEAAFFHYMIMRPDEFTRIIGRASEVLLETTRLLTEKKSLFGDHIPELLNENSWQALLPSVDVSNFLAELPSSQCLPRPLPCDEQSPYRSMHGWCNNLRHPSYGVSHIAVRRLLPPEYDDGFNEPRQTAKSGKPLPGPRAVSLNVHSTMSRDHSRFTLLLMQWGQFLDHDITLTPMESSVEDDGPALDCTDCNSRQTVSQNCWPVPIADNDPVYGPANKPGTLCLPFVRSQLGQLRLGYRNQMNQFSSYIDASQLYGSDECRSSHLRSHQGGRLAAQVSKEGEVLPPIETADIGCRSEISRPCFVAGDSRINEQVGVTSMHALFLREHNTLAGRMAALNPSWDDEKLFQETRRIIIALFQHITYTEFLPKVVGWRTMAEFGLVPLRRTFFDGYDPKCDATVSNEFSTAAFRFGHSLVPNSYSLFDQKYRRLQSFNMTDVFFNPGGLYQKQFCDKFMMGMTTDTIKQFNRFMSSSVRDLMFMSPGDPKSGLDLASLNIQRGRDHGLPGYPRFRDRFQLPVPSKFDDLLAWMDNNTVVALAKVYESVADIDLFTGILSETPLLGALVGQTAAKIIGDQFKRLRTCDRFWYENSNQAGSFTKGQLQEIRKQSLAHIICRNLASIETIQPQVFDRVNHLWNARLPCKNFPQMDLSLWAEKGQCDISGKTIPVGRSVMVSPCTSCACITNGVVKCATMRVKNCLKLLKTADRAAILADTACVVQCFTFMKLIGQ